MVLDVQIFYSPNEIKGLAILMDIYALGIGRRPMSIC